MFSPRCRWFLNFAANDAKLANCGSRSSLSRTMRIVGYGLLAMLLFVGTTLSDAYAQSGDSTERLIQQLQQPINSGRIDAAKKLALRGSDASAATDALIECLRDNNADVRIAAATSLACVQTDTSLALKALVSLLADSDEHVRYAVQWSIARIAQDLSPELNMETATEVASTLATAVREIGRREHQPRHLIATEIALNRVNQLLARQPLPMPPPPAPPVVEPTPTLEQERLASELAAGAYAASDLLGRYHFISRLRETQVYPDALRQIVLDYESSESRDQLLRFAVRLWGDQAQRMMLTTIQQAMDAGRLESRHARLVGLMNASLLEQREKLLELATDTEQSIEVRSAAFESLAGALSTDEQLLDPWLILIANSKEPIALRVAAADALVIAGRGAAAAESRLIPMMSRIREETLVASVAFALAEIAPGSRVAFSAIHNRMLDCPIDRPLYGDLVDACGKFGGLASDCVPQLIKGLNAKNTDSYLRLRMAEALVRIGPAGRLSVEALVGRIVSSDEEIAVKNAAANALRAMPPTGGEALAAALKSRVAAVTKPDDKAGQSSLGALLQSADAESQLALARGEVTSLLRALAICGPSALSARDSAMAVLSSDKSDDELRAAAATVIGRIGPEAVSAAPLLKRLCGQSESMPLRSACLLALAAVAPGEAEPMLGDFANESSLLLQTTSAYAHHLCGHTRAAFEALLQLLDGSETDEVITQSIADLGPTIEPWLYGVACNSESRTCERLACLGLLCEHPQPDWSRLLPLLDDINVGEKFSELAQGWFDPEGPAALTLLEMLRDGKFSHAAEPRAMKLLEPDGLGADDGMGQWQTLSLLRESTLEKMAVVDAARMAMEAASASESLPQKSVAPEMPAIARAAMPDIQAASAPQLVDVFYGTNRARAAMDRSHQELTVSVMATLGGCLLALVFCLVGFVRSGSRLLALTGLVCIGIAAPFGYQAVQEYVRTSMHAPISYSGVYSEAIEVGVCQVSIPPGHKPGELESPNLFRLELKQDVDKHVVLTNVEELPAEKFYSTLHTTLDNKGKNILVFIHGYNVSFEDAARRTAQMAVDLDFPGAPVFYSWPSQANWYGYAVDKENIQLSVKQIKHFLLELAEKSQADTINLVAHSMGNVGLTQALNEMDARVNTPLFNQVVLAAPDIDAEVFKTNVAPNIVGKAKHVTLYTSQTDLALMASRYFNNGVRIGDSATGVPLFEGIDTIDATSVDSSLLGHSYYGSNVTVLSDLGRVLSGQPIAARDYLQAIAGAAQVYWTFDPVRISQSPNSSQNPPKTR